MGVHILFEAVFLVGGAVHDESGLRFLDEIPLRF